MDKGGDERMRRLLDNLHEIVELVTIDNLRDKFHAATSEDSVTRRHYLTDAAELFTKAEDHLLSLRWSWDSGEYYDCMEEFVDEFMHKTIIKDAMLADEVVLEIADEKLRKWMDSAPEENGADPEDSISRGIGMYEDTPFDTPASAIKADGGSQIGDAIVDGLKELIAQGVVDRKVVNGEEIFKLKPSAMKDTVQFVMFMGREVKTLQDLVIRLDPNAFAKHIECLKRVLARCHK